MAKTNNSSFDYSDEMLPKNRKEVFVDVLKLHYRTLLGLSLFSVLFSIPYQLNHYLREVTTSAIYQEYTTGLLNIDDARTSLITMSNQFSMFNIICIIIIGIVFGGIMRIIKRLAWYEPITFGNDFVKGITENGMHFILLSGFIGLVVFVSNLIGNLSTLASEDFLYALLGLLPKMLFSILLIPIAAYAIVVIPIYSNRFNNHIRLSLYLFVGSIKQTYVALLFLMIPISLLLIPNFYIHIFGRIVLFLLMPFVLLKWFLIASDTLDRLWNSKHYPDLMNKGIIGLNQQGDDKNEQ